MNAIPSKMAGFKRPIATFEVTRTSHDLPDFNPVYAPV